MTDPHWYIDAHDRFLSDVTPLVTLCVEGDACGYEWSVNAHGDGRGPGDWSTMASGEAPGIESAKLAAVEAWRRWTKAQAEAAGFVVADPVEPERSSHTYLEVQYKNPSVLGAEVKE